MSKKRNNRRGEARNERVLAAVHKKHKVTTTEIAQVTGGSVWTVQRAVRQLEDDGAVVWLKGGEVTLPQHSAPGASVINYSDSSGGAAEIALLVRNDQAVILDSGPFSLAVAEAIDSDFNGTIITNSPAIAQVVARHTTARVQVIGGRLRNGALIPRATEDISFLENIAASPCVLDQCSVDRQEISTSDADALEIKRAMIYRARVVVVSVSSEALDRTDSFIIGPITKITHLVLQNGAGSTDVEKYEQLGIRIIRP
jgi:DeoR/GlpR family transcriptional regulator of sugar metabolism